MNQLYDSFNLEVDDVFAEAAERLVAGEALDSIIVSYPVEYQAELRDMLMLVGLTQQLRVTPVPVPSSMQRRAAKQSFLTAAAAIRADMAGAPAVEAAQAPGLMDRIADALARFWDGLQVLFTVRTVRLAPLIIVLAFVMLSTSTLVTMAQASVPGDLAYSLKQWMRKQELELAPADQRDQVRNAQEQQWAEDIKRAAAKADHNAAIIQAEDTQVYYGRIGRMLKIGSLSVMDRFQPDANVEQFEQMAVDGELQPGVEVRLTYQILPGQSGTVQGIALKVLSSEPVQDVLPLEDAKPGAAESAQPDAACVVKAPDGWAEYVIKPGDNLTVLAQRGETTIDQIVAVNCLDSTNIWAGAVILVPSATAEYDPTASRCNAAVPEGWVEYTVKPGDNLSTLAVRGATTVDAIMANNCLGDTTIWVCEVLYLPPAE